MVAVDSVADIKEGTGVSGGAEGSLGTLGSLRANPLAMEIALTATGTRPGSGPDKRELFTEETKTVLIFPDGAVIQLSAAVATGQLMFLTNKQTKMEVVSQVVGKRSHRPTSCFVELKFTEEIAGFWGVEFPKPAVEPAIPWTETAKKEAEHHQAVTEEVNAAETTEDSVVPVRATPTAKEVEELREQREALRQQLEEVRREEAAADARAAEGRGEPVAFATPLVPHSQSTREADAQASHVAMKLPNQGVAKIDPEMEAIDQLLPRPELDFSKAPIPVRDPNDPYSIYKPTRARVEKWMLALCAAGLLAAVGMGACQLGFLNRLRSMGRKAGSTAGPANAVDRARATETPKSGGGEVGKSAPETTVPVRTTEAVERDAPKPAGKKAPARPEASKRGNVAVKKNAVGTSAPAAASAPAEVAPVAVAEGPLVPAKLLKAVSPAYPPEAMRNFITGDVRLKAEVDEKGTLRNVQVISGPKALRESAIEALKQYEYAPATRGGEGVASEVVVTIKFWFDP